MSGVVESHRPGTKYVAFQADTEAAFTSLAFGDFQGVYSPDIVGVCEEHDVPYTWLIIVDGNHTEARYIAREVYPKRKGVDEFSIHAHFKWFVMNYRFEHETFRLPERRTAFLQEAKQAREDLGLVGPTVYRQHRRRVADVVAHREIVEREVEMAGLRRRRWRQDDVGVTRRLVEVRVDAHHEFDAVERAVEAVTVGC